MEKVPGSFLGTELPLCGWIEFRGVALFVGIGSRLILGPFKCLQTCKMHETKLGELLHTCDIDRAPIAPGFSRCEANAISGRVDAVADAVDPAETERLVYRLGIGDAWPA